jgi:hypothetical protein
MASAFSLLCRDHCYRFNSISWYTCSLKQSHRWTLAAIKHKLHYPISCNSSPQPTNLLFTATTPCLPINDAGGKRYSIYGRHGWCEYDSELSYLWIVLTSRLSIYLEPSTHYKQHILKSLFIHLSILKAQILVIWWIVLTSRLSIYLEPSTHYTQHPEITFHPSIYLEG